MNSEELEQLLINYDGYVGVYSKLSTPNYINVNEFFIVNTACYPCTDVINPKHWTVLFRLNERKYWFFDSYGNSPKFYGLKLPITLGADVEYGTRQIQSFNSDLCGLYCVYFCHYVIKQRRSFDNFLSLFDAENFALNDEFIGKIFSLKKPV